MTRYYTNQLLEMIEEGILDKDTVINACLSHMSESEVQDMMESNEFIEEEDEEDDEEEEEEEEEEDDEE